MPHVLYNAINGQEAKDLLKLNLFEFINNKLGLKRGNTFHLFRARLRLDIWAVPEDVPTPKDVEFTFEKIAHKFNEIAPDLNEVQIEQLRLQFFRKKDDLDALLNLKEEIDSYLSRYLPVLGSMDVTLDDKGTPDNLRISHGLPLHEIELDRNLKRRAEMPVNYKPVDFSESEKAE
jgi:hypothetical protein